MSVRLLRACAVKMLLEPTSMSGTSASVTLELKRESPAALAFNATCGADLSEVSFVRGDTYSTSPFAPAASEMSRSTIEKQYKDAATALAITHPGTVIAIGAEPRGRVFLVSATVTTGTPVFSITDGSVKAIRLTEEITLTLQMLLEKNYHEAAYALLKSMDQPASAAAAAQAQNN